MTKMTSEDEFPEEFNAYITFLEEQLGTPIKIVSVGPDRAQTIERYIRLIFLLTYFLKAVPLGRLFLFSFC